jgi:hypothetical protein
LQRRFTISTPGRIALAARNSPRLCASRGPEINAAYSPPQRARQPARRFLSRPAMVSDASRSKTTRSRQLYASLASHPTDGW